MQNFSLIQFVLLYLWTVEYNPCRTVPGGQKIHFPLAVFHENYDILKIWWLKVEIMLFWCFSQIQDFQKQSEMINYQWNFENVA